MNNRDSQPLNFEHMTRWDAIIDCYCDNCEEETQVTESEYNTDEPVLCNYCKEEALEPLDDFWDVEEEKPTATSLDDINISGVNNNAS